MKSVRISWKTAQELLVCSNGQACWAELRRAMQPRRFVTAALKVKRAKKRTKKDETAEIREAVMKRAAGYCELCFTLPPSDLHHAFGRVRVKQAVSNCVALCRPCHRNLTDNFGGASIWADAQISHFLRHGYTVEARRMTMKEESRDLAAQSEAAGRLVAK